MTEVSSTEYTKKTDVIGPKRFQLLFLTMLCLSATKLSMNSITDNQTDMNAETEIKRQITEISDVTQQCREQ